MKYVLKRHEDDKYVAKPGSEKSYTRSLQAAQKFDSKEQADAQKCGNESAIPLDNLL